jgi:hypothetical protein
LRQLQDEVAQLRFPADPAEHAAWYREIHARLEALGAFIAAAIPARSARWGQESLRFDTGESSDAPPLWIDLKNLLVIGDDFPREALPFLRQCALRVCERGRGDDMKFWTGAVLGMYAALAGADAVDDFLEEWRKMPPITNVDADSYDRCHLYQQIANLLALTAPPHRYPELAGFLRVQFNALGTQTKDRYGGGTPGQGLLGRIAYALSIFDPESAPAIKARSSEYGLFWRNVQWGLAGITLAKFADMLTDAGAIGPVRPVELQHALSNADNGSWIRTLCDGQNRLMVMNTDYYDKVLVGIKSYDGENYLPALMSLPARMTWPQIDLTHVHIQDIGLGKIRFVHAGSVFEFDMVEEELDSDDPIAFNLGAAAYFNRFLEDIGHPQRIFSLDDGSYFWEKETGVFICADKARFPEMLRQLNHGNELEIKAEMPFPSLPALSQAVWPMNS